MLWLNKVCIDVLWLNKIYIDVLWLNKILYESYVFVVQLTSFVKHWTFVTDGTCSMHGVDESCIRNLVAKPEGVQPLGKPRRRCEDNIKLYIQEVGYGHGLNWYVAGYGEMACSCKCGNDFLDSIKCGKFFE